MQGGNKKLLVDNGIVHREKSNGGEGRERKKKSGREGFFKITAACFWFGLSLALLDVSVGDTGTHTKANSQAAAFFFVLPPSLVLPE
jgi:hypothetical protein